MPRHGGKMRGTMMQLAPLICVQDVEASSRWYQQLIGCRSGHGGTEYERLNAVDGRLLLQLHRWEVEHHHGLLGDPALPHGNGLLLWFELTDFDAATRRAESMQVEVTRPRHWSENGNWELWLKDPDGYAVVLTSPLP
jgi:predicted enzyme related to lactoylglutathione lyase